MQKHKQAAAAHVVHVSADASTRQQSPAWEKVLWKQQDFPDNYTDNSFLRSLEVNAQVTDRDYWQLVLGASAITQQLSTVAFVVSVSVYLYEERLQATSLLMLLSAWTAVCGLCCVLAGDCSGHDAVRAIRQFALLAGGVYFMSPLLQTLTRSVSSDSIVALASGLLVVHLYLHDYSFVDRVTDTLTGSMSLTAATFASVLIASRLNTNMQVFSQVLLSLELYLLSPYARRYVKNKSKIADQALTLLMHVTAFVVLSPIAAVVGYVYTAVVMFITFLCPMWLVKVHKYKAKINGAWDEAVPSTTLKLATSRLSPLHKCPQTLRNSASLSQGSPSSRLCCNMFT